MGQFPFAPREPFSFCFDIINKQAVSGHVSQSHTMLYQVS